MSTAASVIFAELKRRAPLVAFEVTVEPDLNFVWDGDGPDPQENELYAHDVDFKATTVIEGDIYTGETSLGGHYIGLGEDPGEVGGYLVQKLMDAIDDLCVCAFKGIETDRGQIVCNQLLDAMTYLRETLKADYEEQIAKTGYPK